MKKLTYVIIGAVIFSLAGTIYFSNTLNSVNTLSAQMMGKADMSGMQQMMTQIPKDVIIKVLSSQVVHKGEPSEILLQISDKVTNLPLDNSSVLIGIEKGASMTSMMMHGSMNKAQSLGNGQYLVTFTPSESGIYTMHVHVIPEGKSMHAMMQNHLDIGIISK